MRKYIADATLKLNLLESLYAEAQKHECKNV